jgi:FtsZ-binding cell division protein ZapB
MKTDFQPDKRLIEQFNILEQKIDAAIKLITTLRKENEQLRAKITELENLRQAARTKINNILDKIDSLL